MSPNPRLVLINTIDTRSVVIPFSKFYVPVDKNVSSKIGNRALEPQVELVEFDPEMSVADLPSEMKEVLLEISPNFDENLKRAFRNEGVRLQRVQNNGRFIHQLDDVLLSIDDTKIELRNLKFPWIPDFRIVDLSSDLPMSCLDLNLNLGNLRIEGEYEANNTTLRRWLPVSHIGRIVIGFNNVRANGKVGLVLEQDSFVPQNYDIRYEPTDVVIRVSYHVDGENEVQNEISNSDIEATLGKTVWVQLTEILSNLLHRQLGEVVVEFSVTELLVDRDEEYREYAKGQAARANKLLDSLLCSAKDYLVAKDLRTVKTPPFDVVFKGKVSGVQQGTFSTGEGFLQDLATLTRRHSFSLYEDKHKLTIYGGIRLREFKLGYGGYQGQYEETAVSGSIKGSLYKNEIFVKITVKKEGERCSTQLDSVQVVVVKDIDIDISGLASLSWLTSKLKSWVIGHLRQRALPVLETYVKEALLHAITNTDCVAQLVD
nr:PREDICTED: uncharacterized protein LOC663161 isoform X1 [Tribolium castaneum]XP_015838328.1 PREDICTED: uncharacterized protein LOC663161 isoform X1 [Tribolium castaneum]|eukprot:XP_008197004.1 PREDICTED: uncharacterized protein LOC663161 isoform X1 [Tribolium castaneum]